MFVREKHIGRYTYVYLVETVREDGRTKQRIIRNLGRKEDVERRGDLDPSLTVSSEILFYVSMLRTCREVLALQCRPDSGMIRR